MARALLVACFMAKAWTASAQADPLLRDELRARAAQLTDVAMRDAVVTAFREAAPWGGGVAWEWAREQRGGLRAEGMMLMSRLSAPLPSGEAGCASAASDHESPVGPPRGCIVARMPDSPASPSWDRPGKPMLSRLRRARELERHGDLRDVPELRRLAAGRDEHVRLIAACALAELGEWDAEPILRKAIAKGGGVRAWGNEHLDLALALRLLRDDASTLARRGTADDVRARLERGDEMDVPEICAVAARDPHVVDVLVGRFRAASELPRTRELELLQAIDPTRARIEWLAKLRAVAANAPRVGDATEGAWPMAFEYLAAFAEPSDRAIFESLAQSAPPEAATEIRFLMPSLGRRDRSVVIVRREQGGLGFQWCRYAPHTCVPIGTVHLVAGSIGHEEDGLEMRTDADAPAWWRHSYACAAASLLGVQSVIGLAARMQDTDAEAREVAVDALRLLASARDQEPPECLTPPDPRGPRVFESPFVHDALEKAASGEAESGVTATARQALESLHMH